MKFYPATFLISTPNGIKLEVFPYFTQIDIDLYKNTKFICTMYEINNFSINIRKSFYQEINFYRKLLHNVI